jgi:hypothetical protein
MVDHSFCHWPEDPTERVFSVPYIFAGTSWDFTDPTKSLRAKRVLLPSRTRQSHLRGWGQFG